MHINPSFGQNFCEYDLDTYLKCRRENRFLKTPNTGASFRIS